MRMVIVYVKMKHTTMCNILSLRPVCVDGSGHICEFYYWCFPCQVVEMGPEVSLTFCRTLMNSHFESC